MPPKLNPLKLNKLQLKTLAILQALVDAEKGAAEANESVPIPWLPNPHGNHFHIGEAVVMTADATGLNNPSVWTALIRKGLVDGVPPSSMVLTPLGQGYETGIADRILHRPDH